MKKVAIAVASIFTAIAPAAFAQVWQSPQDPYYQSRDQNRYYGSEYRDTRDAVEYRGEREYRSERRDFARVIESRPVQESVAARQECFNPRAGVYEEVREENKTHIGKGAAIGAVTGGVIGHQVDSGGGTALGAILGGVIGHQIERRNERNEQNDLDYSRCRMMAGSYGGREGYEVRYEYDGQEYVTFMDHDPGRRLRVGQDIAGDGTPLVSSWR